MGIIGWSNQFKCWTQNIRIISRNAAYKAISVPVGDHLACKVWPGFEEPCCIDDGHSFTITTVQHRLGIDALSSWVFTRIKDFVFKLKAELFNHAMYAVFGTKKDWVTDFLLSQLSCCSNDHFIVAFREHNSLPAPANLVDDMAHDGVGLAQTRLEFFSVVVDGKIISRHTSYAFIDRCLCNG